MTQQHTPFIAPDQQLPEITLKVILLSIVLTILLAASNTYLALKIGILTSASIPAAIISMGVLRFFKRANILENNLVQTAASAGEAVAGGIVYTIPALVIIHYWSGFAYWENVAIALAGGILGVLFSVPLRRVLMTEKHLNFPEGKAIAQVLQMNKEGSQGLSLMLSGGAAGALLELAQTGFKVIASNVQAWFMSGSAIFGFGGGFSATLIGAGYIIGFNVGLSLLLGAVAVWGIGLPVLSALSHASVTEGTGSAAQLIATVYGGKIHYIGIGAMLVAGLWTLLKLLKPFYKSLQLSVCALLRKTTLNIALLPRTERDIPIHYIMLGIMMMLVVLYFLLQHLFPLAGLALSSATSTTIIIGSLVYIAVMGFIFVAICGYFSGLVGVSASPGSAVIIAGMLFAALILRIILLSHNSLLIPSQLLSAAAITIITGSIIAGAAAIANDNIQDLKVGHIIGATPWKQQLMLLLGVLTAALVIPPVMQLLFHVYGIAGVFPHPGMDPNQTLAAPPAAAMAAITQGVFNHDLPWPMLGLGGAIIVIFIIINQLLKTQQLELSILGIAIGMYLPLSSSIPLFIGGFIALLSKRIAFKSGTSQLKWQRSLLLACGLVSGAALMDVALAIPMGLSGNPNILALLPENWTILANGLGILTIIGLGYWFYQIASSEK